MTTKRIVIIGGPSTGKTTLINAIEKAGYTCFEEISRQVNKEAQEQGIDWLFLKDPLLFSQKLFDKRIEQFHDADDHEVPFIFYDRGLPDVPAYMDFADQEYPDSFREGCEKHKYDQVFILPPWEEIHTTDDGRYESFEEAVKIQSHLIETYKNYGYLPIEVPTGPVEDRMNFILNNIN